MRNIKIFMEKGRTATVKQLNRLERHPDTKIVINLSAD
jgi:hypothetical protein